MTRHASCSPAARYDEDANAPPPERPRPAPPPPAEPAPAIEPPPSPERPEIPILHPPPEPLAWTSIKLFVDGQHIGDAIDFEADYRDRIAAEFRRLRRRGRP